MRRYDDEDGTTVDLVSRPTRWRAFHRSWCADTVTVYMPAGRSPRLERAGEGLPPFDRGEAVRKRRQLLRLRGQRDAALTLLGSMKSVPPWTMPAVTRTTRSPVHRSRGRRSTCTMIATAMVPRRQVPGRRSAACPVAAGSSMLLGCQCMRAADRGRQRQNDGQNAPALSPAVHPPAAGRRGGRCRCNSRRPGPARGCTLLPGFAGSPCRDRARPFRPGNRCRPRAESRTGPRPCSGRCSWCRTPGGGRLSPGRGSRDPGRLRWPAVRASSTGKAQRPAAAIWPPPEDDAAHQGARNSAGAPARRRSSRCRRASGRWMPTG